MARDDSSGVFGGDGSVQWTVDAANARRGSVTTDENDKHGFRQSGINETAPRGSDFTVEIRLPANPARNAAFRTRLRQEADDPSGGDRVVFAIPIERDTCDQIRIVWSSVARAKRKRPAKSRKRAQRKA